MFKGFHAVLAGGNRSGIDKIVLQINPSFVIPQRAIENFLAQDGHILGRLYANANLIAVHFEHDEFDMVADKQGFIGSSRQNQHGFEPDTKLKNARLDFSN